MIKNIAEWSESTFFRHSFAFVSLNLALPISIMVSALASRAPLLVSASSASNQHEQQQQHRRRTATAPTKTISQSSFPQRLAASLAATVVVLAASFSSTPSAALAEELAASVSPLDAPTLFSRNCSGCHTGGGNVVSPGNTLSEADLSRNGMLSSEKLFEVIYSGKGKMPGYGINCAPKGACTFAARLSDAEVKALGDFVLERAGQGWK